MAKNYRLSVNGVIHDVSIDETDDGLIARVGESERAVALESLDDNVLFRLTLDERRPPVVIKRQGVGLEVFVGADRHVVEIQRGRGTMGSIDPVLEGEMPITSPMTAQVTEVLVAEGDHVARGAPLLVIVAMKMNNEIQAPAAGVVKSVNVAVGDSVDQGFVLVVLEADVR